MRTGWATFHAADGLGHFFFGSFLGALIASTGQTGKQSRQEMQLSKSITWIFVPAEILSVGQTDTQIPQFVHFLLMTVGISVFQPLRAA